MVVLGFLICCVERSKVTWRLYYAVREPLVQSSGEECVSKVIVLMLTAGGAAVSTNRGRTVLHCSKRNSNGNSIPPKVTRARTSLSTETIYNVDTSLPFSYDCLLTTICFFHSFVFFR